MPPPQVEWLSSGKPDIGAIRSRIFDPERRRSSPMRCLGDFTAAIDDIVDTLFRQLRDVERSGLCVVALGGYGRGEMWPYSDVDLMLLYRDGIDVEIVKSFERRVWDLGLAIGFSARKLSECASILGDDCATDTALLDARAICGDADQFRRLMKDIVRPFFRRRKRSFLNEMYAALTTGLNSSRDTLYRTEPDVKNGICCLRDCHRIRWSDVVNTGFSATVPDGLITGNDRSGLDESYTFLSKVRTALHMAGGRRIDTLEVTLQPSIAESMGFASGSAAALMGEFFNAVTTVRHCIMSMTERIAAKRRTFGKFRSAIASFDAGNGLRVIDGFLHAAPSGGEFVVRDAAWITAVFTTALTCDTGISTGLRNIVHEAARSLDTADFRDPVAEKGLRDILSAPTRSGRIIDLMHDTGVLGLFIPEFAPLTCRVEFDSYHEYTVDQHSLMALRALDEATADDDPTVRSARLRIENLRVVRLALLLHDAGKALDGDHCRTGAIIARNAAARIGFSDEEQFLAGFLVYHHLDLSEVSFRREIEENSTRQFAETIGTPALLDMLYLLTVLDIRHVGSKTWTGWKAMQLADIYHRIRNILLAGTNSGIRRMVADDSNAYLSAALPEDRFTHEQWIEQLGGQSILLHSEPFSGFYRVTVVTGDRISLLADIAACFVAAGLQLISARVNSFSDAKIVDVFDVEPDTATSLTFDERLERFRASWDLIAKGETTSSKIVDSRMRQYPRKARHRTLSGPSVVFDVDNSPTRTIIEVRAPDRFGLFYTIVNTISSCEVNINAARIATSTDEAADVFYLSDSSGAKITDSAELEKVRAALVQALA